MLTLSSENESLILGNLSTIQFWWDSLMSDSAGTKDYISGYPTSIFTLMIGIFLIFMSIEYLTSILSS
jgi:hypothetical protein